MPKSAASCNGVKRSTARQEIKVMTSFSDRKMTWHYQSFMLRLWREAPDTPYRASLQGTNDGEQVTFADLAALFTFLNRLDHAVSQNQDDEVISPFER